MIRPCLTGLLATGALAVSALSAGVTGIPAAADVSTSTLGRISAVANTCPSAGGMKIPDTPAPRGAVKIYGHGWGHGMGMSQYGAQGAAKLGCGYRTILGTYYSDTTITDRAMTASVTLTLASSSTGGSVEAQTGPVTWLADGRTALQPQGTTWSVAPAVVNSVRGLAVTDAAGDVQAFASIGGMLRARTSGTVVKVRATLRSSGMRTGWGTTRFVAGSTGMSVSHVIASTGSLTAVQKYLFGLGEVPASWPIEALKSQAVAARTFLASKYSSGRNSYVLSTGTMDQVYRGYDQEVSDKRVGGNWRKAVTGTQNEVLVDSAGKVIEAMYSSSMGGHTENRQYVYGRYGISYLKAVDDSRWDIASDNPYRRWSVGYSKAAFASKLGFTSVDSWKVAKRGDSKRLGGIQVTGTRGGRTVTVHFTGSEAKYKLGLRSTGFEFDGTTRDGETGNG